MTAMETDARYVSFCGLYCKECPFYKGKLANKAQELEQLLEAHSFSSIALGLAELMDEYKSLQDYNVFQSILHTISQLKCESTCREGGGSPHCAIRSCCASKQYDGCWQCSEIDQCSKLAKLKPVNRDACQDNCFFIQQKGMDAFLDGEKKWR